MVNIVTIYSIELSNIVEGGKYHVFNFNYDFYCDDKNVKSSFEQKFINHYYFHEIGCETFSRWSRMLQSRLNLIMPYYKKLYETELKSKDINFLLNKDLKEEFTRELVGNRSDNGVSENKTTSTDTTTGEVNSKLSNIGDGVSSASLSDDYLTFVNQDNHTSNEQVDSSGLSKSMVQTDNTERETTTLLSQGNIGTTSSAELLAKWRDVIINIDKMIIDDCRDLFMLIF